MRSALLRSSPGTTSSDSSGQERGGRCRGASVGTGSAVGGDVRAFGLERGPIPAAEHAGIAAFVVVGAGEADPAAGDAPGIANADADAEPTRRAAGAALGWGRSESRFA